MTIRFAEKTEYSAVLEHYRSCHYNAVLGDDDRVVIAIENEIIGAVRIAIEHDSKVLRGMQIAADRQREGIGSVMLKFLADHVDLSDCYCIPFRHLTKFYGLIGFEEIEAKDAPPFLAGRLEDYLNRGLDTIVMYKKR